LHLDYSVVNVNVHLYSETSNALDAQVISKQVRHLDRSTESLREVSLKSSGNI